MTDTPAGLQTSSGGATPGTVRVWDPLVRLFHWSLVAAFAVAWLTAEDLLSLHEAAGYTIAALVAIRLVWGVVGSHYARFAQFVKGPRETLAYLRDMIAGKERRYLGHNPAGAAMIVALLIALSGTVLTGWLMQGEQGETALAVMPAIVAPAWAGEDEAGEHERGERGAGSGPMKALHELLANLTLLLVGLHVGGVVLASKRHHENLARAMITGEKRAPAPGDIV